MINESCKATYNPNRFNIVPSLISTLLTKYETYTRDLVLTIESLIIQYVLAMGSISTLHQGILKGQRVAFKNTSSSLYKLSQRAIAATTKSGTNHPVIE